ncbi:hypothetical protein SeMB42_g07561 [Synchytrium endobioticum]|uniref:Phospholipid/glycerol acyltransferase domain-containing protein n=1 Tax=Synchytrium endobioticum TaxID=286115 RepID=A0A507D4D4_9FUNG|nr:hypothetical protein SeMB42_g07561 [Synchytrium endobioticum]TPX46128.1 hypothetical protein SeLEV6574_g03398 [Synchytrium endobioticum]
MVIISWACAGPVEVVLSGDYEDIAKEHHVVIMANHQTYTDWWWIWILARQSYNHGDLVVILMDILKYIPIAGQGMWFFDFIFLKRKWALDKALVAKRMHRLASDPLPYWLVIFPEGTLNTPPGKKMSHEYAKKMDINPEPVHVLIPRSTGLQYCCENLQPGLKCLFDVTIGYSGVEASEIPYYKHLPSAVFCGGTGPRKVYLHINRFDIGKIPGMEPIADRNISEKDEAKRKEAFTNWVQERFYAKDQKMIDFFGKRRFVHEKDTEKSSEEKTIKIVPAIRDWLFVISCCSIWASVLWYSLP